MLLKSPTLQAKTASGVALPAAGEVTLFADSATGHLSQKDSAGGVYDLTLGAPAGGNTQIQFNNAGSLGASSKLAFDGNSVLIGLAASPSPPAADAMAVFVRKVANQLQLALATLDGTAETFVQPHLGFKRTFFAMPNGNATITAVGCSISTTSTLTAPTFSTANAHQSVPRLDYLQNTPSTSAVGHWRMGSGMMTIGHPTAGLGGFFVVMDGAPAITLSNTSCRYFAGIGSSLGAPTDVEPSSITNIVGFGFDSADSNMQLMYRGAGSVIRVDCGANFPVPETDRSKRYRRAFFSPPGTTQAVACYLKDLDTGAEFTQVLTSNLPANTQFLSAREWLSVGGVNNTAGVALMKLYGEMDN